MKGLIVLLLIGSILLSGCLEEDIYYYTSIEPSTVDFNEEFIYELRIENRYKGTYFEIDSIEFDYDTTVLSWIKTPDVTWGFEGATKINPGDSKVFPFTFRTEDVEGEFGIKAIVEYTLSGLVNKTDYIEIHRNRGEIKVVSSLPPFNEEYCWNYVKIENDKELVNCMDRDQNKLDFCLEEVADGYECSEPYKRDWLDD